MPRKSPRPHENKDVKYLGLREATQGGQRAEEAKEAKGEMAEAVAMAKGVGLY